MKRQENVCITYSNPYIFIYRCMHWAKIALFEMKNIFLFLKSKKLHFYNTLILLYKTSIIGCQKEKNKKIRTIFCIAY